MGQARAVAEGPHGVLPPGVAHDLGVGRAGLGPRRSPRDGPGRRAVAPPHPRVRRDRLGVPVEPGLEDRAERDGLAADLERPAEHGLVERVGIYLDGPASVTRAVEGEVVRRPGPDVEDARTGVASPAGSATCPWPSLRAVRAGPPCGRRVPTLVAPSIGRDDGVQREVPTRRWAVRAPSGRPFAIHREVPERARCRSGIGADRPVTRGDRSWPCGPCRRPTNGLGLVQSVRGPPPARVRLFGRNRAVATEPLHSAPPLRPLPPGPSLAAREALSGRGADESRRRPCGVGGLR
jgi:hypothetical protein